MQSITILFLPVVRTGLSLPVFVRQVANFATRQSI